jgi:hypothetical protein
VTDPDPIDFKQIIAEIEAAGITTYKLSVMVHRTYEQVKRWKKGSEPRHYEGVMLLMIHAEFFQKPVLETRDKNSEAVTV